MAENRFQKYAQPAGSGVVITDPNAPAAAAAAQAEEARRAADQRIQERLAEIQAGQAATAAELARQQVTQGQVETQGALTEQQTDEKKRTAKSITDRMKYGNILAAVRSARAIAQRGGTGWSGLLSALPESDAKALQVALSPIVGNLSFDRLQEMRSDPDNKTGGALGGVSERELQLLGSTVAGLDTTVTKDQFLANLDRIERHFVGAQLAMGGVDPYSEEGSKLFSQFGVALPEQKAAQAGLDATTQSGAPIPPEMQRENQALLSAFMETRDPEAYAIARAELDAKYGFEPDIAYHRNWATDVALPALREGKAIGGAIPPVEEPLEGFDWLANAATAEPTGIGAFAASVGNAGGFGIPTLLAGRDRMEALRGQSPTASFLGEVAGGVTGAMGLAKGAATLGGRMGGGTVADLLANPLAADVAYGTAYGATQAEDPVLGALTGAGSAFVGNKVGGAIAREFPGLVGAGGLVREADEAVPSNAALRAEADNLYTAARGSGGIVEPQATADIYNNARTVLQENGRILPDGSMMFDSLPKVKEAFDVIDAYAGQPMDAVQTDAARKVISDAAGSMDSNEARIARALLGDFDQTVDPYVPGFGAARDVASRYLNDDQIQRAIQLAEPRAGQLTQSGPENALRTEFRALDRNAITGRGRYGKLVTDAIEDVSRGTPVGNVARWFGRFAPRGVVSTGMGATGAHYLGSSVFDSPNVGLALAGTVLGAGEIGRRVAERSTTRGAEVASLLARGGQTYRDALDEALEIAGDRGGSAATGAISPVVASLLGWYEDDY